MPHSLLSSVRIRHYIKSTSSRLHFGRTFEFVCEWSILPHPCARLLCKGRYRQNLVHLNSMASRETVIQCKQANLLCPGRYNVEQRIARSAFGRRSQTNISFLPTTGHSRVRTNKATGNDSRREACFESRPSNERIGISRLVLTLIIHYRWELADLH